MNIYKVEYEPIINRFIYISAESEEEALHLASKIMDKTDAIHFDEADITGVITHVIGAVGEDTWYYALFAKLGRVSGKRTNLRGLSRDTRSQIPRFHHSRILGKL